MISAWKQPYSWNMSSSCLWHWNVREKIICLPAVCLMHEEIGAQHRQRAVLLSHSARLNVRWVENGSLLCLHLPLFIFFSTHFSDWGWPVGTHIYSTCNRSNWTVLHAIPFLTWPFLLLNKSEISYNAHSHLILNLRFLCLHKRIYILYL